MKKIMKTLAIVVDLVFIPIRFVSVFEIALTDAILLDDKSVFGKTMLDGLTGVKLAFVNLKPLLNDIWKN